jgi:hypothetical protein
MIIRAFAVHATGAACTRRAGRDTPPCRLARCVRLDRDGAGRTRGR